METGQRIQCFCMLGYVEKVMPKDAVPLRYLMACVLQHQCGQESSSTCCWIAKEDW